MTKGPFSQEELSTGRASELRKVSTPSPGETVEVGYMITDAILVINRLVEELHDVKARLEIAEAGGGKIKFEATEPFALPSVSGEYDKDLD